MMMECPRCGFSQPKDKYCANCGVDVDQLLAKPKPLWVQIVQNPNFHLGLIGALIIFVIGYIFYSQREAVGRRVVALLEGAPLTSRYAGDPKAKANSPPPPPAPPVSTHTAAPQPKGPEPSTPPPPQAAVASDSEKVDEPAPDAQKIDVSFWEVPRETLANLISSAHSAGESNEGRAYLWSQGGDKISKTVQQSPSRRLALNRTMPLQVGSQINTETPSTASDAFQFGLYIQLAKLEGKDATLRWDSTLILPPAETSAEAASQTPVAKALTETNLSGSTTLNADSAAIIVIEPTVRSLREEYLVRAGDGPWSIFNSEEFRSSTPGSVTDWVVLIQMK